MLIGSKHGPGKMIDERSRVPTHMAFLLRYPGRHGLLTTDWGMACNLLRNRQNMVIMSSLYSVWACGKMGFVIS
jgi:hypothetical protein